MNQPITISLPDNIKNLLAEARDALPPTLEFDITATRGVHELFDVVEPDFQKYINQQRFIFSEVSNLLEHQPPNYPLIGRYLREATQINTALLRLCWKASTTQSETQQRSEDSGARFLHEFSEAVLPVVLAARAQADLIYDLRCALDLMLMGSNQQ